MYQCKVVSADPSFARCHKQLLVLFRLNYLHYHQAECALLQENDHSCPCVPEAYVPMASRGQEELCAQEEANCKVPEVMKNTIQRCRAQLRSGMRYPPAFDVDGSFVVHVLIQIYGHA